MMETRPLAWAALRGHRDAVRRLLDAGADAAAADAHALSIAVIMRRPEIVRDLVVAGADPRNKPPRAFDTPLREAQAIDDPMIPSILREAADTDDD